MTSIDDKLIGSISQQVAPEPTPVPNEAPVMEAPINEPAAAPTPAPEMGSVAQPEAQPAPTPEPAKVEPVDYNKIVAELTGGSFTDVELFKQAFPKIKDYDTLATTKTELEQKLQEQSFANDYVKIFNDLVKGGATPDQLKSFQQINLIGDLKDLSPIDAKVAKLVLIDGFRESVAKKMIERDYPLDDYEEGTDEREIMQEKLRVESNADRMSLEKFKSDLTKVDNSAQENQRLQQLAAVEQHKSLVNQYVPQIASKVNGMGELEFKSKEGDGAKIKFDYPEDFKSTIQERLTAYFMDGNTPVTNENVEHALKHINAVYLDNNFPQIAQKIWADAENATWEKAVNKYENRSGLPSTPEIQVNANNSQAEYNNFLRTTVLGKNN